MPLANVPRGGRPRLISAHVLRLHPEQVCEAIHAAPVFVKQRDVIVISMILRVPVDEIVYPLRCLLWRESEDLTPEGRA